MRTKLGSCITIIFDLEFYVPEKSRKEVGFCYNPWDKASRILGGGLLSINGFTVDKTNDDAIPKKLKAIGCGSMKITSVCFLSEYLMF